jgi:hypothetical protein
VPPTVQTGTSVAGLAWTMSGHSALSAIATIASQALICI